MERAELSFAGTASELPELRQHVRRMLDAEGWAEEDAAAVLLVANELATNAICHARTRFTLCCMIDGRAELEVADHDPEHLPEVREPILGEGGFGLRLVEQLATTWSVEPRPGGKAVRAVLWPTTPPGAYGA